VKRLVIFALMALVAFGGLRATVQPANAADVKIRWDIISLKPTGGTIPVYISAGGTASAKGADGSLIAMTGSGTFRPDTPEVTGGGTWRTADAKGVSTGQGTFRVTGMLSWRPVPGGPNAPTDAIGLVANERAGVAILRVLFSDGQEGTLLISCHLDNAPDSIFEGITATKGNAEYGTPVLPDASPLVDGNRTVFHEVAPSDRSKVTPVTLNLRLTGAEENPPVTSPVSASARLDLSEDKELSWSLTVSGASPDVITGAHIHRGARGVNAPILYPFADGGFTQLSGRVTLTDTDMADLRAGNFYVNVHSKAFPGGAARAQIVLPVSAAPAAAAPAIPISPPSTGDGGLVASNRGWAWLGLATIAVAFATALASARKRA
jgi:hypothetical protein